MSGEKGKINFITTWFNLERKKFTLIQRLELLKRWIETCVSFEEYEMAAVLKKERNNVMKQYRREVNGKRRLLKILNIKIRYGCRKIKLCFCSFFN